MSLPQFPANSPSLTRDEAINQILSSIAMEELGLSHIINAEGEKLQFVLGTLPGLSGPGATINDVLKVNESVRSVLQSAAETQTLLRSKMQNALSASVMIGPTGPAGPDGKPGLSSILELFSGGEPLTLPADAEGNPEYPALVGVGNHAAGEFSGENINLEGYPAKAANFSFIIPRDGEITDLTAYFYVDRPQELGGAEGTVTAQLYQSETPENYLFTKIAGLELAPGITSETGPGTVLSGYAGNLGLLLQAGTRLLLAFKGHSSGTAEEVALTGFGSASVAIH